MPVSRETPYSWGFVSSIFGLAALATIGWICLSWYENYQTKIVIEAAMPAYSASIQRVLASRGGLAHREDLLRCVRARLSSRTSRVQRTQLFLVDVTRKTAMPLMEANAEYCVNALSR